MMDLRKIKIIACTFLICGARYIQAHDQNRPFCHSFGQYSYSQEICVKAWGNNTHYSVGNFCAIADNVTIFLGGNHRNDWVSAYPFNRLADIMPEAQRIFGYVTSKGNVTIGNDVWIGSHVTILSGVTIGDGAIIGAYSVVAKSIPPYAIAVGNPARVIRYRFDEQTITRLLRLKWWDWAPETIEQYIHLLCSSEVQRFLEAAEWNELDNLTFDELVFN